MNQVFLTSKIISAEVMLSVELKTRYQLGEKAELKMYNLHVGRVLRGQIVLFRDPYLGNAFVFDHQRVP